MAALAMRWNPICVFPASSAIATQMAFTILREVGATSDEALVQRGIAYLLDTLDRDLRLRWEIVTPRRWKRHLRAVVELMAKAPAVVMAFDPIQAALIGILCEHQSLVLADLLAQLISEQIDHLLAQPANEEVDMHALPCYLTRGPIAQFCPSNRERSCCLRCDARARHGCHGSGQVCRVWAAVASTPGRPAGATVEPSAVNAHLDYLIATQSPGWLAAVALVVGLCG
ncbi:MAG: hypothetical protein R2932_18740 [Caldilineaceae bacterium]